MPETTISRRSHLANYFNDQNKSVQRHGIVVRWHLLVALTRIFWREGLLTQADCSSRDSRLESAHCSVLTASQYSCTAGGDVDSGCMRLQVTEFCPPCIASAKVLTFFFLFFCGHFSTEKRKETIMRMSFSAEK